jgi:nitrite reductase (NO-forming)
MVKEGEIVSNQILERPEPPDTEAPQTSVQTNDKNKTAMERPLNMWLRATSNNSPALAVIGGAVVAALILVALVISLVWGGAIGRPTSSNTMTMTNQSSPMTASKNVPAHQTFDPQAPNTASGDVVNVKLVAKQQRIALAPDIAYQAWTFNGTVPGPVIRVRQGQTIHFTLENADHGMAHSIDFHAAQTPPNVNYKPVLPGESITFDWHANFPGVFMYHCGVPPVMEHMANGMYGAIIVDPANGWAPAKEYVLVQSEFYMKQMSNGDYTYDAQKAMAMEPDHVTFNGYINQYVSSPLTAKPGERIRLFILDAGPSEVSAFHVIGAIFSDVYLDGNPANHTYGQQTVLMPPGGGAVVELTIPDAGHYPFVTHSFMAASMGAMGAIDVK